MPEDQSSRVMSAARHLRSRQRYAPADHEGHPIFYQTKNQDEGGHDVSTFPFIKPGFRRVRRGFWRQRGISATAGRRGWGRDTFHRVPDIITAKTRWGAQIKPTLTNAKSNLPCGYAQSHGAVFIQSCHPGNCRRGGSGTRWNASLPGKYRCPSPAQIILATSIAAGKRGAGRPRRSRR